MIKFDDLVKGTILVSKIGTSTIFLLSNAEPPGYEAKVLNISLHEDVVFYDHMKFYKFELGWWRKIS